MPAPRSIDSEDVECRAGPCLGSSRFVQARACSDELRSYREATSTAPENSLFVEGGGSGSGDLGRSAARRGFATLRTLVVEAVGTVGNPQGCPRAGGQARLGACPLDRQSPQPLRGTLRGGPASWHGSCAAPHGPASRKRKRRRSAAPAFDDEPENWCRRRRAPESARHAAQRALPLSARQKDAH